MITAKKIDILIAGTFLAIFTILKVDSETGVLAQLKVDSCAALLPKELIGRLQVSYKNWKVLEVSDLVSDDQEIWKKTWSKYCPGVAVGNFSGSEKTSYAIALIQNANSKRAGKLLFADKKGTSYQLTEIYSENKVSNFAVVRKGPAGRYKDFYDRTKPVEIKTETIIYEHIEASAITFYLKGNTFHRILISN